MSRKNIRLYLRALHNVWESIKPSKIFNINRGYMSAPILFGAEKQLYNGVIPTEPPKVLVKDLNKIDLRCYTYHSARNLLRKGKVL